MGLNICVIDRNAKDVPDWDWIRYAGDRDFPGVVGDLPTVSNEKLYDGAFRPVDFPAWRERVSGREWPNPGRFERLLDLLEANPDWWVYYSF